MKKNNYKKRKELTELIRFSPKYNTEKLNLSSRYLRDIRTNPKRIISNKKYNELRYRKRFLQKEMITTESIDLSGIYNISGREIEFKSEPVDIPKYQDTFIEIKAYFDVDNKEFTDYFEKNTTLEMSSGFHTDIDVAIHRIQNEIENKMDYYEVHINMELDLKNLKFRIIQLNRNGYSITEIGNNYHYNNLTKKDVNFFNKKKRGD